MKYCDRYFEDMEKTIGGISVLDRLKGSSVLITGASGLIGSSVSDLLLFLNQKHDFNITIGLAGRNEQRIADRFSIYKEGEV